MKNEIKLTHYNEYVSFFVGIQENRKPIIPPRNPYFRVNGSDPKTTELIWVTYAEPLFWYDGWKIIDRLEKWIKRN